MTTVIVSSDDREVGGVIGSKLAEALGYRLLARPFLTAVAERYDVPEDRLRRVLDRTAGLRLAMKNRDLLLAQIEANVLEELKNDNIVCCDLAAHLYVRDVSHVVTVRVLPDAGALAADIAASKKISPRKAQKLMVKDREKHSRWSIDLFGQDEHDPSLYDMVISLGQIEPEKIVEIIKDMAGYRKFQPMTYSRKCLGDLELAARVRVTLMKNYPDIRVSADGDTTSVHVKCPKRQKQKVVAEIKETTRQIPGVQLAKVHVVTSMRELNAIDA